MPAIAVIGGQWGDEGKGKIVDFLAQDADIGVRCAGGGNAGHSVENEQGKFALRTTPCTIVTPKTSLSIIGRGCVPELGILVSELKALEKRGIDIARLRIDRAAHLVMPWHIAEDNLTEERRGESKLGTTGNGIGPCYADKIGREGFRAEDLLSLPKFKERFFEVWGMKKRHFWHCFYHLGMGGLCNCQNICSVMRDPKAAFRRLRNNVKYLENKFGGLSNLICDVQPILWDALARGERVLLEGAQGYFLDINHGTYPYVTSSSTGVAAAADVCGLALSDITESIGVVKSYCTRVGRGPLPTEMPDYPARRIRELGHEFGTVTGRPRRIGWYDIVLFKRMARANGLTGIAITRLDILDGFGLIGIGVDDGRGGVRIEWVPGWGPEDSVKGCRTWESLPERAKEYCRIIACGVPIKFISVGPAREETIVL